MEDNGLSYKQYYKDNFNYEFKNKKQFLVYTIKDDKKVYYPPEILRIAGLSRKMKNDYDLMSAIAKVTSVCPQKKFQQIKKFHDLIQKNQNEDFNIEIGNDNTLNGY